VPRVWFCKLKNFLLSHNFKSTESDHSLFVYKSSQLVIYLLVYVDDILIIDNDSTAIEHLMQTLNTQFSIKNLGSLNYFLGIHVSTDSSGLHLSQTSYLHSILEKDSLANVKPCTTPMQSGVLVSKFSGSPLDNPQLYRSIVGALQYTTITRPDLTFAVNKASQFMANPTDAHWQLVKRILRYVKGTLSHGLHFTSATDLALHAYYDVDWAGCLDDRRSTTGFAIFLGPNLISWSAKKQSIVSRSSTEAEYRSLAVTSSEILWINSLLHELHALPSPAPTLWCDNLGAIFFASNPVFHARAKHIELDFHFVREKVANRQVQVRFICSADQLGNFFTKGLPKARFHLLRDKLHVSLPSCRLRGAEDEDPCLLDDSSSKGNGEDK
jgi:Reverse transcriptase (RNA-dependent DNA polymerase)